MTVSEIHTPLTLRVTLSAAPGVNATYRTARSGHWCLSARATRWQEEAMLALRLAGFRTQPAGAYWVAVELRLFTIALDVDAPIKLALDTIEAALGIDDRWIGWLTVSKVLVAHRAEQRLEVEASVLPVRDRDEWRELSEEQAT